VNEAIRLRETEGAGDEWTTENQGGEETSRENEERPPREKDLEPRDADAVTAEEDGSVTLRKRITSPQRQQGIKTTLAGAAG
jgi:hypothetical protein